MNSESPTAEVAESTDPDIEAIDHALGTIVRRARLPRTHARLARAGGISLDRAGYVVLNQIAEWQPLRLSDLAARLGVELPTVSRQIKRLEGEGYVERADHPDDGRARLLTLTPAGHETLSRVAAVRHEAIARLLEDWSDEDRHRLAGLLQRLIRSLSSD